VDDVRASKLLSLVLRHDPAHIGIELDDHGWVAVPDLLAALDAHGATLTRGRLASIVAASDKQRFALDDVGDRIRANQGHSVDVDLGLAASTPPVRLYHGTPTRNVDSILAHGLERRARHAVHLSPDAETARRVGARRGACTVFLVDAAAMHADGHAFSVSDNGVWLVGSVPPRYLTVVAGPR
jgi:putative RNA 2'-phosphotransferase